MTYERQIEIFVDYFKNQEKKKEDFKIGIELEHFVIDQDTLETISYYGKGGVGETLKELEEKGWTGIYEGENILGLYKGNKIISLEPGSQIELSIGPEKTIEDLEKKYFNFLDDIIPILEKKKQTLMTVGYHPVTKIEEIKIIPKKRYDYMFEYFKTKGSHAHNMMKGTASLQVTIDYGSEEDYIKKFTIANALSPVLYALYDNGYYFEGAIWENHSLRAFIWANCDNDRSGIARGTFDGDFGYRKYAEYILNIPPIFVFDGQKTYPTGSKLVKEIFDPDKYSIEMLEHVLTMVFPDVRTKQYVEIRMMDSVPYPLNFSAVALIKGLFYDETNLEELYEFVKDISEEDIVKAKKDLFEKGLYGQYKGKSLLETGNYLLELASRALDEKERKYLKPLEELIKHKQNPYEIIKSKAHLGKKESLKWCLLSSIKDI